MIQELKKLVYKKAAEKIGEVTGYNKYRIVTELKHIRQMKIESDILCLEKMLSIAEKEHIPLIVNQADVNGSLVCYVLGISETNPVETSVRFNLTEDFPHKDLIEIEDFAFPMFANEFYTTVEKGFMLEVLSLTDNR